MDWKNATWKERLEHGLEGEGICAYILCRDCPLLGNDGDCVRATAEENEYVYLYRHLLTTVQDFDDDAEIRARIAEMLDDDAREKFLGKAKAKVEYMIYFLSEPYKRPSGCNSAAGQWADGPNLNYAIRKEVNGENHGAEDIIAVFFDSETRNLVLELLRANDA